MLRLTRPDDAELTRLLAEQSRLEPQYPGMGATVKGGQRPAGYRSERVDVELGSGDQVWSRAVAATRQWDVHRRSGLVVTANGPVAVGTTVVLAAPLPVGFAVAACRVVAVVDEPDSYGFAYGTLPLHPEEGEELFAIRPRRGHVSFEIVAFSRPRHLLARAGSPLARAVQVRATRRYLAAMRAIAAEGPLEARAHGDHSWNEQKQADD